MTCCIYTRNKQLHLNCSKIIDNITLKYSLNKIDVDKIIQFILHLWTFKTPIKTPKKYKNVKSILMVLLFLLIFPL
jgi:hypothetical protein